MIHARYNKDIEARKKRISDRIWCAVGMISFIIVIVVCFYVDTQYI